MVDIEKVQYGFVPGEGTTEAVSLRQLQEKYRALKKSLSFCFEDPEKAFDRVFRAMLWFALRDLRVEEWTVCTV